MIGQRTSGIRRPVAALFAAAASIVGLGVSVPATAHAAGVSPSSCYSYHSSVDTDASDGDSGGVSSSGKIFLSGECPGVNTVVSFTFHAKGEKLRVTDDYHDGHSAVAHVRVYNRSGSLVDTDTFTVGDDSTFDLGTPDGSGNIPEDYDVWVKLCVGSVYCTKTDWGGYVIGKA